MQILMTDKVNRFKLTQVEMRTLVKAHRIIVQITAFDAHAAPCTDMEAILGRIDKETGIYSFATPKKVTEDVKHAADRPAVRVPDASIDAGRIRDAREAHT